MNIRVRPLEPPYDYAEIAEILGKTYFREYCEEGALQWDAKYAQFYFESVVHKESSRAFIFGAFDGNKLVGTLFGHRDVVIFDNRLSLEMVNLGLTAIDPEYRRQGIAKKLLEKVLERAKEKNLDFVMAFPAKGKFGDELLKKFNFINFGKTEHLIKLMEERGLQGLRDYLNYNIIMVKLAGLYSHLPEEEEIDGTIRYGKLEEISEVSEILNSYTKRVPLVNVYSDEGYAESNIRFAKMNAQFGDPWGFYWFVLEREGKIRATLSYRIEVVTFEPEPGELVSAPVALLTSLGCHEEMDLDEKVAFVGAILRHIRAEQPDVYLTQITSLQHEKKVFDKLKFVDDRHTYYLYMLPLTEKGQELSKYKKYKEYHLQYYR